MDFADNFRLCGYKDVHQPDSFFLMSYVYRTIDRYYLFDFYVLNCKHYMAISCNGVQKFFETETGYFKNLYFLYMDAFCIDCLAHLW